jgi:hypothetical protein
LIDSTAATLAEQIAARPRSAQFTRNRRTQGEQ